MLILVAALAAFAFDGNADGKIRVFVGDAEQFSSSAFGLATSSSAAHVSQSGTVKYTVLVMKEINQRCSNVVIVNKPESAEYFVRFEVNTMGLTYRPGMAVFNHAGEMIFVDTSLSYAKEVTRMCATSPFIPAPSKKSKKR